MRTWIVLQRGVARSAFDLSKPPRAQPQLGSMSSAGRAGRVCGNHNARISVVSFLRAR